MAGLKLTATGIKAGIWHAVLEGAGDTAPDLLLHHQGEEIAGLVIADSDAAGLRAVTVQIPAERLSEGVQSFVISDAASGETLADFALLAGAALDHDLLAEIALLRAELDMLKRAFRRHCNETT